MNEKVGSRLGLATVIPNLWTELIASQYGKAAPPSGSTPSNSPERRIDSISTTLGKSLT